MAKAGLSPLNVIDEYNGIRDGSVKANFYGDCAFIPDPSELNVEEKNLLILNDCKIKPKHITREGNTIIVIHFTYHKPISVYHVKLLERMRILSFCFHKTQKILTTYTLTIVMMVCRLKRFWKDVWSVDNHNFVTKWKDEWKVS